MELNNKDVAMIAACLGDHYTDTVYSIVKSYFVALNIIVRWTIEFANISKEVENWENHYAVGYFVYTTTTGEIITLDGCCWDDYIVEFGAYKLQELKNNRGY